LRGNTAIWQYGNMAVRQYGSTAVRQYGNTAVQQYGSTAIRVPDIVIIFSASVALESTECSPMARDANAPNADVCKVSAVRFHGTYVT
jgi:hypothetical protein